MRYVNAASQRSGGVLLTQRRPKCARAAFIKLMTPYGVVLSAWLFGERRPIVLERRRGYVGTTLRLPGGAVVTLTPPCAYRVALWLR